MKNLVSFSLCLIFSVQFALGQVNGSSAIDSKNNTHDYYFLKHKKQKKLGWILFGAGLATATTGFIMAASNLDIGSSTNSTEANVGAGLLLVGLTSTFVSIPFLISSGSNKRKARGSSLTELEKPNQEKFTFYSSKHLKQKKVGWILLGGGITLGVTGMLISTGTRNTSPNLSSFGAVLFAVGTISALVGVPFLISSGSNKKKAIAFVGSENIGGIDIPNFNTNYVTLGLLIDI